MPGPDFHALLKQASGLDAASLGPSVIARAVQQRQAACEIADDHAYWLRLRSSPGELQDLIEAVVVPETWFFRDREAFVALAGMARSRLAEHPAGRPLRLLSLPCSSGEEPFSMAIALLDAGIAAERFHIDAVDISRRALDLAAQANYGNNSFRGQELDFRARHFQADQGRWQPADRVRHCVHFQQANLFAGSFLLGRPSYDFVFCRNVLIYFDQDTQVRAIEVLLRLLAPGGGLFVGPSETGLLPRHGLASAEVPMTFAFRHACPSSPRMAAAAATPVPAPVAVAKPPATGSKSPRNRPAPTAGGPPPPLKSDLQAGLAQLRQLANQGRLAEADAGCECHLREHGPSAAGYCLLGLIRDAAGDTDTAARLYRKALYLEPRHQDALTHLALLLDKQGKAAAAQILRGRLQRLEAQVPG